MTKCARCWASTTKLFEHKFKDEEEGIDEIRKVCWNCDWDLCNGGDWQQEAGEILMERAENDYEYDPLYYPKPSWYK